jgi:hypothetical protein
VEWATSEQAEQNKHLGAAPIDPEVLGRFVADDELIARVLDPRVRNEELKRTARRPGRPNVPQSQRTAEDHYYKLFLDPIREIMKLGRRLLKLRAVLVREGRRRAKPKQRPLARAIHFALRHSEIWRDMPRVALADGTFTSPLWLIRRTLQEWGRLRAGGARRPSAERVATLVARKLCAANIEALRGRSELTRKAQRRVFRRHARNSTS